MDKDLLASLESRWISMAQLIDRLRSEKDAHVAEIHARDELLSSKEEQISGMEEELAQLRHYVDELQQEKSRTIARIEALLAKFANIE